MKKIKTSKMKIKKIESKHLVAFILLIYFAMNMAKAQTYYPLPGKNAFWTVYEWDEFKSTYDDKLYTVDGDSTINGHIYNKIYKLNDYPTIYDTVKMLHCLMRQNKDQKKIWFIRTYLGESIEKLGYDLSVAVGDTVSLPAFDYGNIGDSLFILGDYETNIVKIIDGSYRNYYGFHSILFSGRSIHFAEGICDYSNTFPDKYFMWDPFHQSYTECMYENNKYTWPTSTWPIDSTRCGFNLVSMKILKEGSFNLYPNPANNFVYIELPQILVNMKLSVLDVFGNKLNETTLCHGTKQYTFDITRFSPGIYIIELQTASSTRCKKLIINH